MAYTPTTWATGDTVTTTKLNKMEQGIANAGSALIVNCANDDGAYFLDKTVAEIYNAYNAGTPIFIRFSYGTGYDQYTAWHFMMPVVQLFNYAYQDAIKIVATRATRQALPNSYYSYTPSVMIFSANSASAYPMDEKTVYVTAASVSTSNGIDS